MARVMHLRIIVPADRTDLVTDTLVADDRVTNVVVLPGTASGRSAMSCTAT